MRKTILITGVSGFLGSHLALALQNKYNILGVKRKGSNLWRFKDSEIQKHIKFVEVSELKKVFECCLVDCIIHTATSYGRSGENLSEIVKSNLLFSLRLLEYATKYKVKAFVNCDTLQNPLASPYCQSKAHLREYLKYFSSALKIINVKIEHMYGPKDDDKKFICLLIKHLMNNQNIALSKGEQKRDFIYIDDVVRAFEVIIDAIDLLDSMQTFELGSGIQTELRDFINHIKATYNELSSENPTNAKLLFRLREYNKFENKNIKANICALKNLGFNPQISTSEGIKRTILYYLKWGGVAPKICPFDYLQRIA